MNVCRTSIHGRCHTVTKFGVVEVCLHTNYNNSAEPHTLAVHVSLLLDAAITNTKCCRPFKKSHKHKTQKRFEEMKSTSAEFQTKDNRGKREAFVSHTMVIRATRKKIECTDAGTGEAVISKREKGETSVFHINVLLPSLGSAPLQSTPCPSSILTGTRRPRVWRLMERHIKSTAKQNKQGTFNTGVGILHHHRQIEVNGEYGMV